MRKRYTPIIMLVSIASLSFAETNALEHFTKICTLFS